eukprot:7205259-Lingulodinium_polyedra.AAC.1
MYTGEGRASGQNGTTRERRFGFGPFPRPFPGHFPAASRPFPACAGSGRAGARAPARAII